MEGKPGILDAYIPIDRRRSLASGKPLPSKAKGAVLFADISGFTQLTGDLTRDLGDQRGADEITQYLNKIYSVLIAEIHKYQGSVISFAGDAITCWFDQDPGVRAIAAGFGLQAAIAGLVNKYTLPVGIKIVIASGPASRFIAGNPDIQLIDLLAGKTLTRVTKAEKLAKPGELLVSKEIADQYQTVLSAGKSQSTPEGDQFIHITGLNVEVPVSGPVEEPQLPDEILSQWMLSPVYEKIRQGEERFLAELRLTVCLFMKFDGIDYDKDPYSGLKINQFICWVQECITRHDGHLLQVIIGDKGDYLYIGFGALSAHEDDSSRAIAAARVLRQPTLSLAFIRDIQIGITLGRMLTGPLGSSGRRTYSMLGASANLAARLMERAAAGQILLSERVAIAAQKHFLFDPQGAVRFKGIEHAVPVFALIGARNETHHIQLNHTPLVGRVNELALMLHYAGQVSPVRKSGIILLQGEGGIGKTRLLSEIMRKIHEQDITILSSFGYTIENSTPYYVVRELFGQLFSTEQYGDSVLAEYVTALVREINPEWERLMPLLSGILPIDLKDNDLTSQMYGEIRAGNLHTLLTGIFRKIAWQKSFLIIIDDAQWVDAASWALLHDLAGAMPQLGLILALRPFAGAPPSDYLRLVSDRSCTEIHLANFDRADIERLVCQVVGAAAISPGLLALIYDKTSGHPYFSEELAYALAISGMIVIEDGHCRLSRNREEMEEVAIPDTIQSAITSRLDRMTLPQQLTLKVASIMGRLFAVRAVHGIHPTPPGLPVLHEELEAMTRLNLIAMQVADPDAAYSFRQIIIHDVAYNMLSFTQRHELHRKAASWYEEAFPDTLSQHYSHLGYHWQQAEEYGKAAGYFEKAAFDAMAKGAYRDGIIFIRQALAMEKQAGLNSQRKASLLIELGIAHFKTGALGDATMHLKTGIRTLQYPAPSSVILLVANLMRQSARQLFYRLRSNPPVSPAPSQRETRLALSRAYEYLAQSYFHHNKLFYSLDAGLSGLNVAESAGPSAQLARAYGSLCITTSTMPIPGLAEAYASLAQSLLSGETGLNDHGRILELIAVAWSGRGRWEDIEQLCTRALGMATEIGDRFLMMENTCILAACLLPQGKLEESVKLREELYGIGLQDKVELVQGWALLQRAEIAQMRGEFSATLDLLTAARAVEHALGQPDRLWLHGMLAGTYIQLGDLKAAGKSAEHALVLARQSLPTSFFVLEGYAGMMMAFMVLSASYPRNRKIIKQTGRALAAFGKYAGSFPIGQPRYLFCKGKLAMQRGQSTKAVRFFTRGLNSATELRMVYEAERLEEAMRGDVVDTFINVP